MIIYYNIKYKGKIGYKKEAMMASTDQFRITLKGVQAHAAYPWKVIYNNINNNNNKNIIIKMKMKGN